MLAAAGVLAGAASSSTTGTETFVENAKRHLVANGVDPSSIVVQQGAKNYAGPNCPGATWNCTSAGSVVQVGAQNTHECTSTPVNTATMQECIISQLGPQNSARCIQKKKPEPLAGSNFFRQRCSITQQNGVLNEAVVVQLVEQTSGEIQGVLQEVGILQTATTSTNRLQITQEIKQFTETTEDGVTQDQDAYQIVGAPFAAATSVSVPGPGANLPAIQSATLDGDNGAQITQTQIQRAIGGAIQKQNDGFSVFQVEDCYEDPLSVEDPNACINLSQSAVNGTNGSDAQGQGQLAQKIEQEATTNELNAFQQQGAGPFAGGADGHVDQLIGSSGAGTSQNQANQTEILKLWAPPDPNPDDLIDQTPVQEQFGGASCCGFGTQFGGVGNSEEINQQKSLEALGGGDGTLQIATLVSTSSTPTGTCQHSHDAQTKSDTNSDQANRSASAGGEEGCPGLALLTVCENSEGGVGDCQETEVCVEGDPQIDVSEGVFVSCGGSFFRAPVPFIGNLSSRGP